MHAVVPRIGPFTRLAMALLASAVLAACNDPTRPTMQSVAGRYALQSVNGTPLPWVNTFWTGPGTEKIMAVELELSPDGTFVEYWRLLVSGVGGAIEPQYWEFGSFTVAGSDVVITYDHSTEAICPQLSRGPIDGDRLTVTARDGRVFVYVKQP